LALAGDAAALRLCLDRIVAPRREPPCEIDLPKIRGPADVAGTVATLIGAAERGKISDDQAFASSQRIETYLQGVHARKFDRRIWEWEEERGDGERMARLLSGGEARRICREASARRQQPVGGGLGTPPRLRRGRVHRSPAMGG
jgi:hypothetical protein